LQSKARQASGRGTIQHQGEQSLGWRRTHQTLVWALERRHERLKRDLVLGQRTHTVSLPSGNLSSERLVPCHRSDRASPSHRFPSEYRRRVLGGLLIDQLSRWVWGIVGGGHHGVQVDTPADRFSRLDLGWSNLRHCSCLS